MVRGEFVFKEWKEKEKILQGKVEQSFAYLRIFYLVAKTERNDLDTLLCPIYVVS